MNKEYLANSAKYYRRVINYCFWELQADCPEHYPKYMGCGECEYIKLCQAEIERDKALQKYWGVLKELSEK